jgi:hypothetical protein
VIDHSACSPYIEFTGRATALKSKVDNWNPAATLRNPDDRDVGENPKRLLLLPPDVLKARPSWPPSAKIFMINSNHFRSN